jgi:RNA polymerase sigma-70 factor (ECF subfamily)
MTTHTKKSDDLNFDEIVSAYYQPLYRFGYSLAKNEHEAGDLAQQTFFIYAEKGASVRDQSKVKSWLFTTLYREFLRRKRRDGRIDHYEPEMLEAEVARSSPISAARWTPISRSTRSRKSKRSTGNPSAFFT